MINEGGRYGPHEMPPEPTWQKMLGIAVLVGVIVGYFLCPDLTWLFE